MEKLKKQEFEDIVRKSQKELFKVEEAAKKERTESAERVKGLMQQVQNEQAATEKVRSELKKSYDEMSA